MVQTFDSPGDLAYAAAEVAAEKLTTALARQDTVRILAATGASQLQFLAALTAKPGINWNRVELFHLDEYVGIDPEHPASFNRYLREHLIHPAGIRRFHLMNGLLPPEQTIAELNRKIAAAPIDLALAGIGENAHLAFNDPPADFDTDVPYLLVDLDDRCRLQQVGEGWFASLDQVPRQAISISIKQLLQAREIISVVPGKQKAMAVHASLSGRVTPLAPASALRLHPYCSIFLDRDSASLLPAGGTEG